MAELPIIKVQTQAPDVSQAIRLANAAVEGLSDYLDTKAADESITDVAPAARAGRWAPRRATTPRAVRRA